MESKCPDKGVGLVSEDVMEALNKKLKVLFD